jgi:hypothetical protein
VGPGTGMDDVENRKILPLPGTPAPKKQNILVRTIISKRETCHHAYAGKTYGENACIHKLVIL